MKLDNHLLVGILVGAIIGVFYATHLTPYMPLLVILAAVFGIRLLSVK